MSVELLQMLHPGLLLILAGLLVPLAGPLRAVLLLAAPAVALFAIWTAPDGAPFALAYAGYELEPVRYDATSRIFALIFGIAAFAGGMFALSRTAPFELAAAFVYAGAAIGAVLAGDFVTLFVFWEIMAVAATFIVWSGGSAAARAAGLRYAAIHLFGGVLLMAGIAGEAAATGSIAFEAMTPDSPARWLILAGFLINAGAWPLSAWVADAYPESSWAGMVFLSAFTTKTAVYALMRGFPAAELLVVAGLAMVLYGIVYALREDDMRRMLAYSLVSQVGFMVTGVGIGSELALNGVAAHAFAHIVYKALLLMAAGAVIYATGSRRFSEMGGLARAMPWTAAMALIGALSISAAPLTSGFVSKSMIVDAAGYGGDAYVWLALTAASAGTALYAGFAFMWFGFLRPGRQAPAREVPASMRLAMLLMAALCLAIGVWPEPLYALLPFDAEYAPYTASHVVAQLQLILAAGIVFVVSVSVLARRGGMLDIDWFWRGGGRYFAALYKSIGWLALEMRRHAFSALRAFFLPVRLSHDAAGSMARSWSTGAMAFWAMAVLVLLLIANYW
jgi:multicomponent Na+:H+ antiporter subunit D